jgi:hypothetical protein
VPKNHFDCDHVIRQFAARIPKIDLEGERIAPRVRADFQHVKYDVISHQLVNQTRALGVLLFGAPNFFVPRMPPPAVWPPGSPDKASYYDNAPLMLRLRYVAAPLCCGSAMLRLRYVAAPLCCGSANIAAPLYCGSAILRRCAAPFQPS